MTRQMTRRTMLATAAAATATAAMTLAAPVSAFAHVSVLCTYSRMVFGESRGARFGFLDTYFRYPFYLATDKADGTSLRLEVTNNSSLSLVFYGCVADIVYQFDVSYSSWNGETASRNLLKNDSDNLIVDAGEDYLFNECAAPSPVKCVVAAGETGVLDLTEIPADLGTVRSLPDLTHSGSTWTNRKAIRLLCVNVSPTDNIFGDNSSPFHDSPTPFTYKATWLTGVSMHRLYNPYSGEHHYTSSTAERDTLVKAGWRDEGVAWTAPASSKTPVYRLYNKYTGDHHYTMDKAERDACVRAGWNDEGIGWYSDDAQGVALRRGYNPYATVGTHHYTTDASELKNMVAHGWKDEGTAWYGMK